MHVCFFKQLSACWSFRPEIILLLFSVPVHLAEVAQCHFHLLPCSFFRSFVLMSDIFYMTNHSITLFSQFLSCRCKLADCIFKCLSSPLFFSLWFFLLWWCLQADLEGSVSVQHRLQSDHGWTQSPRSPAHIRYNFGKFINHRTLKGEKHMKEQNKFQITSANVQLF